MAALAAEEPVQIKIRYGAFKGKLPVLLSTTVGQLKHDIVKAAAAAAPAAAAAAAGEEEEEQLGRDFELKLIVKGKVLGDDAASLGGAGLKKSSLVKAIEGAASAARQKTAALSSAPGEQSVAAGPRQRCKGGCGFWGGAATDWYCSSCHKDKSGVEFDSYTMHIHKATYIPIKIEYEKGGEVYRVAETLKVDDIQGYKTVTKSRMKDLGTGSETVLEYVSVEYDTGLPEGLFTERYLRKAPRKYLD